MKTHMVRIGLLAGALIALGSSSVRSQIIEFRATIDAAQETTGSTSPATGTAMMIYDVATNRFDLTVTINNLTNTIAASHIHEAAVGVAGPVVTGLGAEAVYIRNGTTVTLSFVDIPYGGTPLTLLRNGAYFNVHSAQFPGGEVRGQLIAQPKHLVAILTPQQASASSTATSYGAAMITYDPGTNKIWTRIDIYNFTNTFSNSHYHEAPVGAAGPVVHGLGGASVYTKVGPSSYHAVFANQTYLGDTFKLLQGGAYLNVHSNVAPGGEIRGQVMISEDLNVGRLANVAARGFVGTGDQVLINGFVITGSEPVRVLVTARGPSLTAFGVSGALSNPMISLHDSAGREIMTNDDYGTTFSSADLIGTGFAPSNASEAALLIVLPPGVYTSVVSGVGGATGIAVTEVYEVRPGGLGNNVVLNAPTRGLRRLPMLAVPVSPTPTPTKGSRSAPEFCVSVPLATVALGR
jgi:hypothetical protein